MKRIYLATLLLAVTVILGGINYFHIGDRVQLHKFELTNDAALPYPYIQFTVSNQGDKNITAIRANVNAVDLPYTFAVSKNTPIESSRVRDYAGYTAWYEPGGGVGGYLPSFGDLYKIRVTLFFSDGSTKVYRKIGRYWDRHSFSIGTLGGFDILGFEDVSLLAHGERDTINLDFRNDWVVESPQTVRRLELQLGDDTVWEEDVRVNFTGYFVVTVEIPFELESGRRYNVTLIAYSNDGNNSTFTESALCQKYDIS